MCILLRDEQFRIKKVNDIMTILKKYESKHGSQTIRLSGRRFQHPDESVFPSFFALSTLSNNISLIRIEQFYE